jgi:hypothetical protein
MLELTSWRKKFTDVSGERATSVFGVRERAHLLLAAYFFAVLFDPGSGGFAFLRDIGELYPTTRRHISENSSL